MKTTVFIFRTVCRKKDSVSEIHYSTLTDYVMQTNHSHRLGEGGIANDESHWAIHGIKEAILIRQSGAPLHGQNWGLPVTSGNILQANAAWHATLEINLLVTLIISVSLKIMLYIVYCIYCICFILELLLFCGIQTDQWWMTLWEYIFTSFTWMLPNQVSNLIEQHDTVMICHDKYHGCLH